MTRSWQTWLLFALCLLVVFAAMGWVTVTAVRLERSERETRRQAALEENARLALWRMDSAIAPLIAQESARPYFAYSAFYPAERAYTRMFNELQRGEVLVPSPLLALPASQVILHFQFGPDGELTSPQAPTGNMRDLAETGYTTAERIEAAAARLDRLRRTLDRRALLAELRFERPMPDLAPAPPALAGAEQGKKGAQWQSVRNAEEFQARGQQYEKVAQPNAPAQTLGWRVNELQEGTLKPIWMGGELLLVRRVRVEGRDYVQGCLLDWPAIKASLLAETRALLPAADLAPVGGDVPVAQLPRNEVGHLMAALPVRLAPGAAPSDASAEFTPITLSLLIAWVCVLCAAGAGALVLAGALSLSERRGAFVSAVTHELRTPLTTFKMYAEMLAEDMVPDAARRKQYLETLRAESVRLGHLVENVLAYARLERGRAMGQVDTVTLEELVARPRERLAARAGQAGMHLIVEPGAEWGALVRVDPSVVEQVLFNLVDNACKYAVRAEDRRIHIQAGRTDGKASLRISDHGPGIDPRTAERLFRAFHKSAREAANSAPGIGLGLSLSRRLARAMGGDLRPDFTTPGACFLLLLPEDQSA